MTVVDFLSGFAPLLVLGSIAWVFFRLVRGAKARGVGSDPAATVRQIFVYGLMFVTMILVAQGTVSVIAELAGSTDRFTNSEMAGALSLVIVGAPAFTTLLYLADRRLAVSVEERGALLWTVYLNLSLLVTLIATMVSAFRVLRDAIDTTAGVGVEAPDLVAILIWGGFWVLHWVILRRRHGIAGDAHFALGSVIGAATLGTANVGILYVLADEIYTEIAGDPLLDRAGPTAAEWGALFAVGFIVWGWFWLANYESAQRTAMWYAVVIPVGALIGHVAMIVGSAVVSWHIAVWFAGDHVESGSRHFDQLPFLSAVLVTGFSSWMYYRWIVRSETTRNDASRSYDYLLAAASLVTGTLGCILLTSLALTPNDVDRNELIAGLVLLAVGAPLWLHRWHAIGRTVADQRAPELRSPVRRIYVYVVVGVAAVTALISGMSALQALLTDVLDGDLSTDSLADNRLELATLVLVGLAAWFHGWLLFAERSEYEPPPPPPPAPPASPFRARRLSLPPIRSASRTTRSDHIHLEEATQGQPELERTTN